MLNCEKILVDCADVVEVLNSHLNINFKIPNHLDCDCLKRGDTSHLKYSKLQKTSWLLEVLSHCSKPGTVNKLGLILKSWSIHKYGFLVKSAGGTWPFTINPCDNCKKFVQSQPTHHQHTKCSNNSNTATSHFTKHFSHNHCLESTSSASSDFDRDRHVSSPPSVTAISSSVPSPTTHEDIVLQLIPPLDNLFLDVNRTSRSSSSPELCTNISSTLPCQNDKIYSVSCFSNMEADSFSIPYRVFSSPNSTPQASSLLNIQIAADMDICVEYATGSTAAQSCDADDFDFSSTSITTLSIASENSFKHPTASTASLLLPINSSSSNTIHIDNLQPDIYDTFQISEDHFDLEDEVQSASRFQQPESTRRTYQHKRQVPERVFFCRRDLLYTPQEQLQTIALGKECFVDLHLSPHKAVMSNWYRAFQQLDCLAPDLLPMAAFSHDTPRKVAWITTDPKLLYNYVKHTLIPKPVSDFPLLQVMFDFVEKQYGYKANGVLVNLYETGKQYISWHQDDEDGLGEDPSILSISLQDSACRCRKFVLRDIKWDNTEEVYTRWCFPLVHGTVLIMRGSTQHHFEHTVPQCDCIHPRINLNFRQMKVKEEPVKRRTPPKYKPLKKAPTVVYGHIDRFPIGKLFTNRVAAWRAGIHRQYIRGICGNIHDGAESIVLANAKPYENTDQGNRILYCGAGRGYKQSYACGNGALAQSYYLKRPVRVLRKAKCSKYGPKKGVRYDGLFYVISYTYENNKFYFELHKNKQAKSKWIQNGLLNIQK